MRFTTTPIAVVGCGEEKLAHGAIAEELYTGPIFAQRIALARAHATTIFIASASYGLIPSTRWIDPYERCLSAAPKSTREAWARDIAASLRLVLHASPGPVLALVSGPYAGWVPLLRGDGVDVMTVGDGLPVGKLRAALSQALSEVA